MNEREKRILSIVRRDINNLKISFCELKKRCPNFFGQNLSQYDFITDDWDVWKTDDILEHLKLEIDDLLSEGEQVEKIVGDD